VGWVIGAETVVGGCVLAMAVPASAHIEPDPAKVKPGATATVAFNVEHGCETSPTIMLTFKIPKGATRVAPVPKDGWTATAAKGTVVFSGGSLDATTEDTFSIAFTAPNKKTVLVWKVVQQCDQGVIRWIDTAKGAEFPPPAIGVGKNPPKIVEKD
jgi:periplasmic copper chaperone A